MSANIKGGLLGEEADEDLMSFASESADAGNEEDESNGVEVPAEEPANTDNDDDLFALLADDSVTTDEEVDTPAEEQKTEDELSPEAIASIAKRYKNDPIEMAKAIANAQKQISKQGNEIGTLRRQPETVEYFAINTDKTFDPLQDPIDEDTGWPVDSEGNVYKPKDAIGIEYLPPSRLEVLQQQLTEKHGTNYIAAQQEYERIISKENERMSLEFAKQEAKYLPPQLAIADRELESIEADLTVHYPAPIAKEISSRIKALAIKSTLQAFDNGIINEIQYLDKNMLAQSARTIYQSLTAKQKHEAALEIKAALDAKAEPAGNPLTNGKRPAGRPQAPPRPAPSGTPRQESNGFRRSGEPDYSVRKMEFDLD